MSKNMDEAIRMAKLCYHLFKQISELSRNWQNKKNENMDQRKKGFKPSPFRKGTTIHTDNNYSRQGSTNKNGVNGIVTSIGGWNNNSKEVKCCDVMDLTYIEISHTTLTEIWHP